MGLSNFVISVRNLVKDSRGEAAFGNDPGPTRYLVVPDGETPHPLRHKTAAGAWVRALVERATCGTHADQGKSPVAGYAYGDILVFVHGYNNSMADVMHRHDLLQKRLRAHGFRGAVVSFDWPSANLTLNYLEDRADARATAIRLVQDGIAVLARNQLAQDRNKCDIDVHLLGHSTGAYVIREAFYEADHTRSLSRINWQVSQIALIGADIPQQALSAADGKSQALFRHAIRITNYQNPFDSALKASNVKRLGTAPRAGRVGAPDDAPANVVNVNVGPYWRTLDPSASDAAGNWSHSWHFDDPAFSEDLFHTITGDIDRAHIPTRRREEGELYLRVPK